MTNPRSQGETPARPSPAPGESLIERAMRAFETRPSLPTASAAPAEASPSGELPSARIAQFPLRRPQLVRPVAPDEDAPPAGDAAPQAPVEPAGVELAGVELAEALPAEVAAPVVHAIDRDRLIAAGIVLPGTGASAQLEEFRIVKRQLLHQAEDLRRQSAGPISARVMVASAHSGEGKTFCALNLALSIAAEKDTEVLLVDLDMACFTLLQTLGLPQGTGLIDAIADPAIDVRDCVMATDIPGLSVLAGGRASHSDAEYLASARAEAVLAQLSAGNPRRIILFDTPPVLMATLPAEVAKLSGQVVMVVLADKTSSGAVQDAVSLLAGCPNVQLLLNAVQFSPSGRRFGSYHGYRG
ncbi:MAG TPA: capsular biosynthesis protein [Novosphingobium sp.]|nr:capsular biosynthesis protein [Novosphingobium sp.]